MSKPTRQRDYRRTVDSLFAITILSGVADQVEHQLSAITRAGSFRCEVRSDGGTGAEIVVRMWAKYWEHRASIVLAEPHGRVAVAIYRPMAPAVERLIHPARVQVQVEQVRSYCLARLNAPEGSIF